MENRKKICSNCKIEKSINEFSFIKTRGFRAKCKTCLNEQNKSYNEKNKDKLIEYRKNYRLKNINKIKAYDKIYQKENKEKLKEYKKLNKDKVNEIKNYIINKIKIK